MRGSLKFLLWFSGIAAVVVGVVYLTLLDVWTVPGDDPQLTVSIQPSLGVGDVVLIARRSQPDVGELVRCLDPDAPGRFVIGRVVGISGQEVSFIDDSMRVNGRREPTGSPCDPPRMVMTAPDTQTEVELVCNYEEFAGSRQGIIRGATDHDAPFTAKADTGRIFLASDNRRIHMDSRDFGQLNPDTCTQLVYRLWSAAGIADSKRRFTFLW